jgi:hypothetical protein
VYSYSDAAVLDSSSISCKFFLVLLCCVSVFTPFSVDNNLSTARTCRPYSWCCASQCQGRLKFFEGVHKLLLPPENSPKACSDYYPWWFLKRPSNKTSRYTPTMDFIFFLVRFCFVYIKDTLRSIRFQLCFITSMQIHKCRRRMLQIVNSIVEFKILCSEDGTHCSQDLASWPSMPHRHSPYHLWLKVQIQLCRL